MAKNSHGKPPWEKKNPNETVRTTKKVKKTTLSGAKKAEARARARKAGRPYPNLIDNMAVAQTQTGAAAKAKRPKAASTAKKKRTAKTSRSSRSSSSA